jgi:hypothetical protein
MRIFNITTTDLLLGFSAGEVPKADGLYIGLTKLQPLLHSFHELFFGVTKVEEESQETASPRPAEVAESCKRMQRGGGSFSSEINLSDV